jgi:hypothetical protein
MDSPVRRVPIKVFQGIRGVTPEGQEYESTLESDYLTLLRFDPEVQTYRTQPCRLSFQDRGKTRTYTPDILVEYKSNSIHFKPRVSELIEIKPRAFIEMADPDMLLRHNAAREYAESSGWIFRVVTEEDIPAEFLDNAKFLLRYIGDTPLEPYATLLLENLRQFEEISISALIRLSLEDEQNRAQLLTELWTLISQNKIGVDLQKNLTMSSIVWSLPI